MGRTRSSGLSCRTFGRSESGEARRARGKPGAQVCDEPFPALGAPSGTYRKWRHYRPYRKKKSRTCTAGLGSGPHPGSSSRPQCCPAAGAASPRAASPLPAATACSALSSPALVRWQPPSSHLSLETPPLLTPSFRPPVVYPWFWGTSPAPGCPFLHLALSLPHPAPRHHAKELSEWQQHWLPGAAGKQGGDIRRGCWQDGEGGPKGGRAQGMVTGSSFVSFLFGHFFSTFLFPSSEFRTEVLCLPNTRPTMALGLSESDAFVTN